VGHGGKLNLLSFVFVFLLSFLLLLLLFLFVYLVFVLFCYIPHFVIQVVAKECLGLVF
jgi:hypothetical protein